MFRQPSIAASRSVQSSLTSKKRLIKSGTKDFSLSLTNSKSQTTWASGSPTIWSLEPSQLEIMVHFPSQLPSMQVSLKEAYLDPYSSISTSMISQRFELKPN